MIYLFNYIKIGLWSLIYNYINHDKIIIDIITDNIKDSGCVAIKFTQWFIPLYKQLYGIETETMSKLEELYDRCKIHSIEITEKSYYHDFSRDLYEDYEIIDIISSASIGQVYKICDKKTKEIYAMKVVHPNINKELYFFEKIIHIIYSISYTKKWFINIFPIDLSMFIENFKQQTNMENEVYNCNTFYEKYKYSENIVIPKVIKSSRNILIMNYEESNKLDSSDFSSYKIKKFYILFLCFIQINQYDLKFMHGDIHNGNWGIRNNNNKEELVIYDFGFCWEIKGISDKDLELISYFTSNRLVLNTMKETDKNIMIERMLHILLNNIDPIRLKEEIQCYNEELSNFMDKSVGPPAEITRIALKISKNNGIFINHLILQILIICSQYTHHLDENIYFNDEDPLIENMKELICISDSLVSDNLYSKFLRKFLKDNKSIDMISPEISDNIDILKNLIV